MNSVSTVTVLFTDIVASTRLRTSRGDLLAHGLVMDQEATIRAQVKRHRGREVKALGDGLMIVFGSARDAVECAVDVQRDLAGRRSADAEAALEVRMGIHTGDAISQGGDFHGAAVVAATRIMACAKGGEILISEMVRGVIGATSEISIRERGRFALKGFPSRWRLYQVRWQDEFAAPARRRLTVLVTDLKGSTAATDRLGDDAAFSLLRSHNAIIRAQATAHCGRVLKSLGDGFLISFDHPTDAVACAAAIQRAFAGWRRQGETELVNLRMAVHAGEFIEEAGDLYGRAIMVAFHVLANAAPGEVLVTEAVRRQMTEAEELGPARTLKLGGISEPEAVYSLCWENEAPAGGGGCADPGARAPRSPSRRASSRRSRRRASLLADPPG